MRILIVHNQLWAHYKAIIFNELQKKIAHRNDSLMVVQIASIEKSRKDLGDFDNSIHQYPYILLHSGFLEEVSFWQRCSGILKSIQQFKPDVVNLTGYYDIAAWMVLFYCKIKGIKTVLSNESTANDHNRRGLKELIKSFIIRQFDGYFNFGTLSEKYILSLGIDADKMLVKKNCVDNTTLKTIYLNHLVNRIERQKSLEIAPKNFIFVGRLIEYKNLYCFMEAFHLAQKKSINSDWGIIILGDGELKAALQDFVSAREMSNVSFQKGVSWRDVPKCLSLSDVLVLPSSSEPWGLVVNEAMACGLPVVVSNNCGCAVDLVREGVNGFTFAPDNTQELSNILIKFMNKSVDIKQMGLVSEHIIQAYTSENVASEMYAGFQKVYRKNGYMGTEN